MIFFQLVIFDDKKLLKTFIVGEPEKNSIPDIKEILVSPLKQRPIFTPYAETVANKKFENEMGIVGKPTLMIKLLFWKK